MGDLQYRAGEVRDASLVDTLVTPETQKLFSVTNVVAVIEKAIFSVTVFDSSENIVGHACFYDYPNVQSIKTTSWEEWTAAVYEQDINPYNTLFLRFFVAIPELKDGIIKGILKVVFSALPELEYVAVPTLRGVGERDILENHLASVFLQANEQSSIHRSGPDDVVLWIATPTSVLGRFGVRKAAPEDYDDLVPIFDQQAEFLQKKFGEFFLYELIEAENDTCKSVVLEVEGKACGFFNVTKGIDTSTLNELFDLSAFNHLNDDEGQPSVLSIRLFAIDAEYDTQAIHFFPYAFDSFKDKNYCIITLPSNIPEFPLLQQMTRVLPRPNKSPDVELYVLHRFSLSPQISLRPLEDTDVGDVEQLLSPLPVHETIMADVSRVLSTGVDPDGCRVFADIVECMGSVAGIIVSRDAKADAMPIRAHFSIEEYILYSQYQSSEFFHLYHFVFNRLFQRHSRFVLRELLRKHRKSCIFYRLYPSLLEQKTSLSTSSITSLSSVVDQLVPVRPRPQPPYDVAILRNNVPSKRIRQQEEMYALTFTARKLVMEPKVTINSKIVIIGPSATALSCIEDLCFRSHLRFNNLIYVSEDGSWGDWDPVGPPQSHFTAYNHLYTASYMHRVALHINVSVMNGPVEELNREKQYFVLSDGTHVDYNTLVYTPDLQYIPHLDALQEDDPPEGVYSPTLQSQVDQICDMIRTTCIPEQNSIVVYGASPDAFAAVTSLLELGVQPVRIVFVVPPNSTAEGSDIKASLGHQEAVELVQRTISKCGVRIHSSCVLENYISDMMNQLVAVKFRDSDGSKTYEVRCRLCMNYSVRTINKRHFLPLVESCLVFNQRLIIDNTFRTNDPNIFSAGAFARYSSKYYAIGHDHCVYRPEEAGRILATVLCQELDPLEKSEPPDNMELPVFKDPQICYSLLPDNLHFFHAQIPNGPQHNEQFLKGHMATSWQVNMTEMITGGLDASLLPEVALAKDEDNAHLFVMRLDEFGIVCEVICICKRDINVFVFERLIGLHEQYLNSAISRYNQGLIGDFFKFFREPWAVALFNDRFRRFLQELTSLIRDNPGAEHEEIENLILKLSRLNIKRLQIKDETKVEDIKVEEETTLQELKFTVNNTITQKLVKDRLMDFLTFNSYHLPMYARPGSW
eukprot:gene4107-42_t